MLRGIRKASENWLGRIVMGVVMFLLAGVFGLWGINDIFTGFGRSTLAKIGNTEIAIAQFQQTYRDRLNQFSHELGKPLPPQEAAALGLDRQVLGEMVAQAGMDQQARQMGLGIPDSEIARHITTDPNLQTINGQFDRNKFEQILRNIGTTEQRFVADQRQTALRRQIIDSLIGDVTAPKAWLDAINRFQNELRSINYVVLGPAQAGDIPQPTDEELSKYFDERKIMFRAPEYRKIDIVAVTPDELAKWMEVSEDDIKSAYDKQRSRFTTPERRHIQQIIFPNMADAQAAADRIKAGTSFAAIAAERGLKEQDTDLGTVTKSSIVDPAVADAAFALKEGEVAAPVQGRFGAILVTVLKIEPEVTKSLADVSRADSQRYRARARQDAGAGLARQDRGRSRRRRVARTGRREAEAADRHRQCRPFRPRSGRQADDQCAACRRRRQRRLRLRRRRRQRSARRRRRLYLVFRRRHRQGARSHPRRSQSPGRAALARR